MQCCKGGSCKFGVGIDADVDMYMAKFFVK